MDERIPNLATDLFAEEFDRLFVPRVRARVADRIRQRQIERRIGEVADAAGQGLARQLILIWPEPSPEDVDAFFQALRVAIAAVGPDDVWPPGGSPEAHARNLANRVMLPGWSDHQRFRFGLALEALVASLWQAGRVFVDWQEAKFGASYEPVQGLVRNLQALGDAIANRARPDAAADERFELTYRDYLLQRFARLDVGTLRAVSAVTIGVDALFVMPDVERRRLTLTAQSPENSLGEVRPLSAGKALFNTEHRLKILIGAPGGGKSTLLLWVLRQVAAADRVYVLAGEQAIPVLVRVRELHGLTMEQLRQDRRLIELATGSRDIAGLMPDGWLDRQLAAGRILLLLDGLDETEGPFRDEVLLPWLTSFLTQYAGCQSIVTSRPTGFPQKAFATGQPLGGIGADEYTLLDFGERSIRQYLRGWFTQVRLAQSKSSADADRGGTMDADSLWASIERFRPVAELARNPLLLSAICLIYHFEGGRLPDDRAVLYGLCVEGLIDRWDTQRGLGSRFKFADKLLFCRELAAAMTGRGLRECPIEDASLIARAALSDPVEAGALLDHLRDRAGLVMERTPGTLSFVHLTFQEYLTAVAIRDENRQGMTIRTLVEKHTEQRWREVILLFCRLAPPVLVRQLLDGIRAEPLAWTASDKNSDGVLNWLSSSAELLISAFSSCPSIVQDDLAYRDILLGDLVSLCFTTPKLPYYPAQAINQALAEIDRTFSHVEVLRALAAHSRHLRCDVYPLGVNVGGAWLFSQATKWDTMAASRALDEWERLSPGDLRQSVIQYYCFSSYEELATRGCRPALWQAPLSSQIEHRKRFQSEAALLGLAWRVERWAQQPEQKRVHNPRRNVLDHVPEQLFCDLLETYSISKWPRDGEQSALFIMLLSRCRSQPAAPGLRDRFVTVCTGIAERLSSMSGARDLREWVSFLQATA